MTENLIDVFKVSFAAYCGMVWPLHDDPADYRDARSIAAHLIRMRRRDGLRATVLESGARWEFTEPEDAMMVPDEAGVMTLTRVANPECPWCGNETTDPDDKYCDEDCWTAYTGLG